MTTSELSRIIESLTDQQIESLEWLIKQKRERDEKQALRAIQASFTVVR